MTAIIKVTSPGNYETIASPRCIPLITTDNYLTITDPGYINKITRETILPTDTFKVAYDFNESTQTGTRGTFLASISSTGIVTLVPSAEGFYSIVPITSDEFKGAFVAPKLLVAAPGTGLILKANQFILFMKYNSVQYADGGTVRIHYSVQNLALASVPIVAAAFFENASSVFNSECIFDASDPAYATSLIENNALMLSNITGAFTAGNSPFEMHIWYSIIRIMS